MRIFPIHKICLLYILFILTPISLSAKPSEPIKDDPLLQEKWIYSEARRARGFAHRIGELIEKIENRMIIKDKAKRKFKMKHSGKITFNPFGGNYKPVIPHTSEAPLFLAEAEALYKIGLKRQGALFTESPGRHEQLLAQRQTIY